MKKAIRILAILSIVFEFLYMFFGRLLAPVYLLGSKRYREIFFMGSMGQRAIPIYYALTVFSFLVQIIMLVYCVLTIIRAGSNKKDFGVEISGLVILAGVLPILSLIRGLITTPLLTRLLGGSMALSGNSIINSVAGYAGPLHSIALGLLLIALSLCIGYKAYGVEEDSIAEEYPE